MPHLSIIVPHHQDSTLFEQTLVSVLENRPADCEVIVPHYQYDDPYDLAGEVEFVEVNRKSNFCQQINAAVTASHSDIIHCLASGAVVTEGWCDWAVSHFHDPYIGSVVPVVVTDEQVYSAGVTSDLFARKKIIGAGKQDTQRLKKLDPLGPTSVAGFYRKEALEQLGDITKFGVTTFDLEIAMALQKIGFETKLETDSVIKLESQIADPLNTFQGGLDLQRTLWRMTGDDGFLKSLLVTSGAGIFELVTAVVKPSRLLRILGRTVAIKDVAGCLKFNKVLEEAAGPHLSGQSERILKIDSQVKPAQQESSRRAA